MPCPAPPSASPLSRRSSLGACSSDPNSIAQQAKEGDQKGYIAGNGAIEQIPVSQRLKPIALEGTTLDGKDWSSTSARGKDVVVINRWGSWCPPCITEIPDLEKVWTEVQAAKKPVQFMGIDFRESLSGERRSWQRRR
jgi:thiol-disulfide isomerase/thioredoxin